MNLNSKVILIRCNNCENQYEGKIHDVNTLVPWTMSCPKCGSLNTREQEINAVRRWLYSIKEEYDNLSDEEKEEMMNIFS